MPPFDRGSRGDHARVSASSLSAQVQELQRVVRRTGFVLERLHTLCMIAVQTDGDVAVAERLNDELKPLIDALLHFEVTP